MNRIGEFILDTVRSDVYDMSDSGCVMITQPESKCTSCKHLS